MNVFPLKVIFFDIGDTLVKSVPGSPRAEWMPGAKEQLIRLSNEGVRFGLISNTGNMTWAQLLNRLPADFPVELFEDELIILSSRVGVEKPKYEIFALAVDKAGVAPVECLFCTETLSHTLAAQEIGMRAVWLPLPKKGNLRGMAKELINSHYV